MAVSSARRAAEDDLAVPQNEREEIRPVKIPGISG